MILNLIFEVVEWIPSFCIFPLVKLSVVSNVSIVGTVILETHAYGVKKNSKHFHPIILCVPKYQIWKFYEGDFYILSAFSILKKFHSKNWESRLKMLLRIERNYTYWLIFNSSLERLWSWDELFFYNCSLSIDLHIWNFTARQ